MAGVTEQGFELKRLADIVSDAEVALSAIADPVTGDTLQPDFSGSDPTMQVVLVPLDAVSVAWEAAQGAYNQFDPSKASPTALEGLVQLNGLTVLDASFSTVPLTLAGTPGALIPAGQIVADVNNRYRWATNAEVTLDGAGAGATTATCQTSGPIVLAPTRIVTPVVGWASVAPGAVSPGRDRETPSQLRVRRSRSTMAPAASPIESVQANLANLAGVSYCRTYQNNTLAVDGRGVPAKCIATVIVGGDDTEIAQTLLARSGANSGWAGTTTVTLYDALNEPYAVQFSRPTPDPVYLVIQIQVYDPTVFPADGLARITQAILTYAQGGAPALGIEDGFGQTGFPPGSPVQRTRLFTPLNFVPGHKVASLKLGTAPAPAGEADIAVLWDHYAQFDAARISLVVVP